MSKIERLLDDSFNLKHLIDQREKEYEKRRINEISNWGDRGEILDMGKTMDKILFHRGKNIVSARKQVELMYDWFLNCEDRRTRVIGKAWFQKVEGTFDSIRENPLFAEFFSPDDKSDSNLVYHQRFYTYKKAMRFMKKITEGRQSQYILTNPVFALPNEIKSDYGRRTVERLTEMHVLYAEIDHYRIEKWKKKDSKAIWKVIKKYLVEQDFPLPTEVVFSRGIHLYWKHAPIPAFMVDEWRMMMKYVNQLLADFGADVHALDPVRILRAVGSIHEKTGKKITGLTFSDDRYDFMELFNTYCHEEWQLHLIEQDKERKKRIKTLEKRWLEKQRWMFENEIIDENGVFTEKYTPNKKQKRKRISAESKSHRYNSRHKNIIDGVFWLSDVVRKGNMEGHREFSCYLVRTMALRVTGGNTIESLRLMEELYRGFSPQRYSWSDIVDRTKSAELDYKRWQKNETLGVKYKTSTLIKKLKITPSEMQKMRFIVDETRSRELNREYWKTYQKQKRKEMGAVSQDQTRALIREIISDDTTISNVQVTNIVKEKLGKCSRNTVIAVRKEMDL